MYVSELRIADETSCECMSDEGVQRIARLLEEECERQEMMGRRVAQIVPKKGSAWPKGLKVAACLMLVFGVGVVALLAPETPMGVYRPVERALAYLPLRPVERAEFVCSEAGLYDTPQGVYFDMPLKVFSPGISKGTLDLRLEGARGVFLSAGYLDPLRAPSNRSAVTVRVGEAGEATVYVCAKTNVSHEQFEADKEVDNWPVTLSTDVIESLKDARIVVRSSGGEEAVYSLDFSELPERDDIALLVHQESSAPGRPAIITLVRED